MITRTPSRDAQLRKLHADLGLKRGDLAVAAGRLRRAVDAGKPSQAARWRVEVETVKAGIEDAKRALAELEGSES